MSDNAESTQKKVGKAAELIKKVARGSDVSPKVVKQILAEIGQLIPEHLDRENEIGIPRVGTFYKSANKETGKVVIRFRPYSRTKAIDNAAH